MYIPVLILVSVKYICSVHRIFKYTKISQGPSTSYGDKCFLSNLFSTCQCPIPRPQVRNLSYWWEMWLTSGQPSHFTFARSFSVMQTMLSLARNLFTFTLKWDTSTFSPLWRKAFSCMAGVASQSHVIVYKNRKYCIKHNMESITQCLH